VRAGGGGGEEALYGRVTDGNSGLLLIQRTDIPRPTWQYVLTLVRQPSVPVVRTQSVLNLRVP
jgi:hypothetical protein